MSEEKLWSVDGVKFLHYTMREKDINGERNFEGKIPEAVSYVFLY